MEVSKYPPNLSKEAKELLYRPPKVKALFDKYWQLAKVAQGLEKIEHDEEILRDHRPRFPKKTPEEVQIIESIYKRIELLGEEDKREMEKMMQERVKAAMVGSP